MLIGLTSYHLNVRDDPEGTRRVARLSRVFATASTPLLANCVLIYEMTQRVPASLRSQIIQGYL
jgi:hypothetical protein